MKKLGGITTLQAIQELGNTRLSASIFNLKKIKGVKISAEWIKVVNRFGEETKVKRYFFAK